jgi:glutaminase
LHEQGRRIRAWQLQGHLIFSTTEVAVRDVVENMEGVDYILLDFKRVLTLDECAGRLLYQLLVQLTGLGKTLVFVHSRNVPLLRRYLRVKLRERFDSEFRALEDNDRALEWCENQLLEKAMPNRETDRRADLDEFVVLAGFTATEREVIAALLKPRVYAATETLFEAGDDAGGMFFLRRGQVSVLIAPPAGERARLATFSAGMTFGEMAMIDRAPRSAMIVADADVECDMLALEDFDRLDHSDPAIKIKLLNNLCLDLCHKLRKANRELNVFG